MYDIFGPEFNSLIISLLLASFLGGLIGYEREKTRVPAGFRTHVLVTVGSALVMAISRYMLASNEFAVFDPQRMGAQVISGIGFLGAGTIIRYKASVKGLTTAAGLWASACVGLACGAGFYSGAVAATIIILITLIVLKKLERKLAKKSKAYSLEVFTKDKLKLLNEFIPMCKKLDVDVNCVEMGDASAKFKLCSKNDIDRQTLIAALKEIDPSLDVF